MSSIFSRIYAEPWEYYSLLDAGGGKKLERFADIITIRPEVQAYFQSEKPFTEWNKIAHAEFVQSGNQKGKWKKLKNDLQNHWTMPFGKLNVLLEFTNFKHVGIFPEQAENWRYIQENLQAGQKFLNLFAYTGIASLVARQCGAEVTHVDSLKQLISWSKSNMEMSALSDIRWVLEDALKFAQREVKRGNKYDGIIMDPPAFGIGSKGEKWILEQQLPILLETASQLLTPDGFLILNTYSPKVSNDEIQKLALRYFPKKKIEINELWINAKSEKDIFAGNLMRIK